MDMRARVDGPGSYMARKTLGISWLNGQFHAAALTGGAVTGAWAAPKTVTESDFAAAVAEAIRATGFNGTQAMVIIDHRSLLFHVQDIPPAEGKVVDQVLDRLVERGHFFEEKAAWGRLGLPEAKGRHRYLLALLPESLIQALVAAFAQQRIELVGVFPIAAVLGDQLRLLAAQETETILLAADLGDAIHLLLGTGDGQVLFSRTVVTAGQQPEERAAQEINRTLHYAQQQFGATVNKLFVHGEAFHKLKNHPIRAGLMIAASPGPVDPFLYARHVFLLSPKLRLNFLPPSALKKKSARTLAAMAVLLLAATTLGTTVVTELHVRARERTWQQQARQSTAEADIRSQSVVLNNEASRWRALLSTIGSTNNAPVPELFLRALPGMLPEAVRLTRVDLIPLTNGWQVRLEGLTTDAAAQYIEVVNTLEERLALEPFRMRILNSTRRQLANGGGSQSSAVKGPGRAQERPFFIEGLIE
jgi:hypothetical protein